MSQHRHARLRRQAVAGVAAAAVVSGIVVGAGAGTVAGAAPARSKLARGIPTSTRALPRATASVRPADLPAHGRYAFLLALNARTTHAAFAQARNEGRPAAREAAARQLDVVAAAQRSVAGALPRHSQVLYGTHAVLAGLAVSTNVKNYAALTRIAGVHAVYPIAPKTASNSYAVPLQQAPEAWTAYGDLGADSTVAVIDTGVDYTHADLGGPGAAAAYDAAHAAEAQPIDPASYDHAKFLGGYDFAGDAYNADPASASYHPTPAPDPNPLDCNGHGTHVAGTIAGYGENADGTTYTGSYNTGTPFASMKIGPGIAPEAKVYAYRVFGCEGSTNLVGEAIDRAADPNDDGDTSDHVNVINMSLGSDYGAPDDGDSVAANAAAALGITVVAASGNAGDLYDAGGSPADATRVLAVAASADAQSIVDSLNVTAPNSIAGSYAAERSLAYDWSSKQDLAGNVVALTEPGNLDGCQPYDATDAARAAGNIVFLEWTDNDATRLCGSVQRGSLAAAAGAVGFVFADDEENFAAGITGSDQIPGVIVAKSGGDAIRAELQAGNTVTIGSTTRNGFTQIDPSQNDQLAAFSSRGIGDAGDVKPDVAAVGLSVFSAAVGTGTDGMNDSGTSMATPMVAGAAALVSSAHPDWTPEQVKADIMNTAGQDVYLGPNHTGPQYAPNRVGAGRIDVKAALDNGVLAYSSDDPGAVSVSFGTVAATGPVTLSKSIKVENTTAQTRTYDVSYDARTTIPGADYSYSPDTVTLDPHSSKTVTVTLTVDPSLLTKTIDPTVARVVSGLPREYQADASGLLLLSDAADSAPVLRVPVYAAPRPASTMTEAPSLRMPGGAVQEALLPLQGTPIDNGSGAAAIHSTVAGFELTARSGPAPACSDTLISGCVALPDERSADLKYVGVTSDAPQVSSIGLNPIEDGLLYFSITTQGPWRTPAGSQEFDIDLDTDGDGVANAVLFNTRLPGTDVFVSELYDLASRSIVDIEGINDRLGNTDTALFGSDTLVMPVAIGSLSLARGARVNYGVSSFSNYQSAPIDSVGFDHNGALGKLSVDPLRPGLAVYGSYYGDTSALLYRDSPGSVLKVHRDVPAYAHDGGLGALLIHFHNEVGDKAQVMRLSKTPAHLTLAFSPSPAQRRHRVTATVHVGGVAGLLPTGKVVLRRSDGPRPHVVASGVLKNGTAVLRFSPVAKGLQHYQARYVGDSAYSPASGVRALRVTVPKRRAA